VILLIDHDDSFVHTLASYVEAAGENALVRRVSTLSLGEVEALAPRGIILSPGPGTPEQCVVAQAVVHHLGPRISILGVCLGHQVIATVYGATVARASRPRHGMTSPVTHDALGIFAGVPSPLPATRYHSLSVCRETLPGELLLSAVAQDDGAVMGIRHRAHPVEGVQFHPESVLTEYGMTMIRNFLAMR
jgi:anthranilate synthase/aminodeoxychorismate synthase-like glutamine amidotransferase